MHEIVTVVNSNPFFLNTNTTNHDEWKIFSIV